MLKLGEGFSKRIVALGRKEGESTMTTREKKVSMNRAEPDSLSTNRRLPRPVAVLALALVALIAGSVLPGYSAGRRTAFAFKPAQVTSQSEGFKVTPTFDSEHAVTQIVPANGGTMTATGADGATFTLIVPAKALLSSARVTMTPVSTVSGLPLSGGLAAAVRLEPDGLRLFNFATLIIEPPQSVSPNQETSFAWDQAGDDFHLFPMQTPNSTQRENARGSGAPLNPRPHLQVAPLQRLRRHGTDGDRAAQRQRRPPVPRPDSGKHSGYHRPGTEASAGDSEH
jgi:hypothetical protein